MASHQLLCETAGRGLYDSNVGHFWVFEGFGTYFETVTPQTDGSLWVGGLVGPRVARAYQLIFEEQKYVPLARLATYSKFQFNDDRDVYLHYAESMALTVFFMDHDHGRYRQAFLDYLDDAFRGRFRPRGT